MDFFEVVEKRGTYRLDFKDQQISNEDIKKIVNAGLHALSGYNFQTMSCAGYHSNGLCWCMDGWNVKNGSQG